MPVPGTVSVRVNEQLSEGELVAEAEVPERYVFLDVARALNVPEGLTGRYLTCDVGDRLSQGDRIAEAKGLFSRAVRAPGDGRVIAITEGRVLFEVIAPPYELRSRYPCVVGGTDGVQAITVETSGALIQGVWGNGKRGYGPLRLVGNDPGTKMTIDTLNIGLRSSVMVAGFCDSEAPFHQATELSVRGVILGGIVSSMVPFVRRLSYPVVVLEGFGHIPINIAAYQLLDANQGKDASLDATPSRAYEVHRPEIIIPMLSDGQYELSDEVVPLTPGVRVRVLRQPHMGAVGVVREVLTRAVSYPSGNMARSARLDLEGKGSIVVPLANLEVLS
jgi:hypothetical protein